MHYSSRPDYSDTGEAQEKDLKTNFMKMLKIECVNPIRKSKIVKETNQTVDEYE